MSKLTESARDQPCTLNIAGVCNYNTKTTVLCHIRFSAGMAKKPNDLSGCYGCFDCHNLIDDRTKPKDEYQWNLDKWWYISRAMARTHISMSVRDIL